MSRVFPVLLFLVCATLTTSVDAQLFRRFFAPPPQSPAVRSGYDQPQARYTAGQQLQQLQFRQFQNQQSPQQACYQRQLGQQQGQRYQVYYNPRTNQRYLQPVGPRTQLLSPQQKRLQQQTDVARQVAPRQAQPAVGPVSNLKLNAPKTVSLNGPTLNGPTLNGPAIAQPSLNAPIVDTNVVPVSGIEPAAAAPAANVVTASKIPADAIQESAAETGGSFSVLEDSKDKGSILEKDPGSLDIFGTEDK